MGIVFVILAFLILAAFIYGIFFLIFKLGWIIAGSSRNKWPLILAGVATVLLFAVTIISTMVGVNKYIMPIMPVVEKTIQKTDITTGIRPYTDPQYGFSINLFGGTEMTEWINIDKDEHFVLGFDTNIGAVAKKRNPTDNNSVPPISGFVVYVQKDEPLASVEQYLQEQADEWLSVQSPQVSFMSAPDFSVPNTVFLEGEGSTDQGRNFRIYVTIAAQDDLRYAVVGFVTGNPAYYQLAKEEIRSFRPAGMPPAPLVRNTAFTVPAQEQQPALPEQPAN